MLPPITSVHNPRVKNAVKLRSGRDRNRQGRILIDGLREIQRAHQAGVQFSEVFACLPADDAHSQSWIESMAAAGIDVFRVAPNVFTRLAYGQIEHGAVAVATPPCHTLDHLSWTGKALVIVLEGVEKPGNVGAVVRSADAAGASAVIVADGATDLYNPNAIRASLGTIFAVPVCAASSRETLDWLRRRQLRIFTARVDAAVPYTQTSYREPAAIVLGSEAQGLSDIWQGADMTAVSLPMRGLADSLNVSTTAAVVLYEALRQREQDPSGIRMSLE
jgi:TrmH family RNA methyltransferase